MLPTKVRRDDADAIDEDLMTVTADARLAFSLNTVQECSLRNGGPLTSVTQQKKLTDMPRGLFTR